MTRNGLQAISDRQLERLPRTGKNQVFLLNYKHGRQCYDLFLRAENFLCTAAVFLQRMLVSCGKQRKMTELETM